MFENLLNQYRFLLSLTDADLRDISTVHMAYLGYENIIKLIESLQITEMEETALLYAVIWTKRYWDLMKEITFQNPDLYVPDATLDKFRD